MDVISISHSDPPPAPPLSGESANETCIIHLTTRFNIEAGLGKDDFDLIPEGG